MACQLSQKIIFKIDLSNLPKFHESSIEVFCENDDQRYALKKVLLNILYISRVLGPLFNKVTGIKPATLLKETPAQVFFYEICEIFKNTYFGESKSSSSIIFPLDVPRIRSFYDILNIFHTFF